MRPTPQTESIRETKPLRVSLRDMDAQIERALGVVVPLRKRPFLRKCYRLCERFATQGNTRALEAMLLLMHLALKPAE